MNRIDEVITQSASCNYTLHGKKYQCILTMDSEQKEETFTNIVGQHLKGKSDNDIQWIAKGSKFRLENFPPTICKKFKNIDYIKLEFAEIESFDKNSFENCKHLEKLILSSAKIQILQEYVFANNRKLKHLHLSHNKIEHLPNGIFDSLIVLEVLYLNNNSLTELAPNLFKSTIKLKQLWLHDNHLTNLPEKIFTPLVSLDRLLLYNNKLTTVHSDSFGSHPQLKILSINSNHLVSFDEHIIERITALTSINSELNPCGGLNIFNDQKARKKIRSSMKKCFANYKKREKIITTTTEEPIKVIERSNLRNEEVSEILDGDSQLIEVLISEINKTNEEIAKLKSDNEDLKKRSHAMNDEIKSLSSKVNVIDELKVMMNNLNEEIRKTNLERKSEVSELMNSNKALLNTNDEMKSSLKTLKNSIEELRVENKAMNSHIEKLKTDNKELMDKKVDREEVLMIKGELNKSVDDFKAEIKIMNEKIERNQVDDEIKNIKSSYQELNSKVEIIKADINATLKSQAESRAEEMEKFNQKIEKTSIELKNNDNTTKVITSTIEDLKAEINTMNSKIESKQVENQIENLKINYEKLNSKIDIMKLDINAKLKSQDELNIKEIENINRKLENTSDEVQVNENAMKILTSNFDDLKTEIDKNHVKREEEHQAINSQIEKLKANNVDLISKIEIISDTLRSQFTQNNEALESLKGFNHLLVNKTDQLKFEIDEIVLQNQAINDQIKNLKVNDKELMTDVKAINAMNKKFQGFTQMMKKRIDENKINLDKLNKSLNNVALQIKIEIEKVLTKAKNFNDDDLEIKKIDSIIKMLKIHVYQNNKEIENLKNIAEMLVNKTDGLKTAMKVLADSNEVLKVNDDELKTDINNMKTEIMKHTIEGEELKDKIHVMEGGFELIYRSIFNT